MEVVSNKTNSRGDKNEMFLCKDISRKNAWLIVAFGVELGVMQIIWMLAEEKLSREEMETICYSPQTNGK